MTGTKDAILWTCRDCEAEIDASDSALAMAIGWTTLDGDAGQCPSCGEMRPNEGAPPHARALAARIQLSLRAVDVTRERVRRWRARLYESAVAEAATLLGFQMIACRACKGRSHVDCGRCDGTGSFWRSDALIVSRADLLALAMWRRSRKP